MGLGMCVHSQVGAHVCVWGARVRVGVCRGWHTVLSGLVFSTHGVQRSCPSAWPVSAHPGPHVHGGQVRQHLDNCIFPVLGKHLNPMTSLGASSPEKGLVRDDFIQQTPGLEDTLHRLPQAPWLWPRGSDARPARKGSLVLFLPTAGRMVGLEGRQAQVWGTRAHLQGAPPSPALQGPFPGLLGSWEWRHCLPQKYTS